MVFGPHSAKTCMVVVCPSLMVAMGGRAKSQQKGHATTTPNPTGAVCPQWSHASRRTMPDMRLPVEARHLLGRLTPINMGPSQDNPTF
jgi:hypothetical protein